MKRITFFFLFIFSFLYSLNYFSFISKYSFLKNVHKEEKFNLPENVIYNSVEITSDSLSLNSGEDYQINYEKKYVKFKKNFKNITIKYQIIPEEFQKKFQNFTQITISDTLLKKIKKKRKIYSSSANLNISGYKTISFSLSNKSDIDFDQTLFLKVNGQLYQNMYIESQLSDNQTPISPEGTSKELSNLDKIFIRIYGKQYELKFGDLEMVFDNTKFINYHPIFEGVKAKWFHNNYYKIALALSKGKKGRTNFYGVESKQGPYYLSKQNLNGIKIVPGSEEIYLDGEKMQRGEDYTIDYSEGSILFTDKHFISSSSYITAYFLYSDENYKQNLYLANTKFEIGKYLEIYNRFIWEKDDKNNPLGQIFSNADIDSLKKAGDHIAWGNGVTITDNGKYKLSEDGNYYIYAPDDTTAIYNIRFTYVGTGNGDYIISDDKQYFIYAGPNQGDYTPKVKLIPPQNNLNYDLKLNLDTNYFNVITEAILTNHDKNSFSKIDDNDNFSKAFYLSALYRPDYDKLKPFLKLEFTNKGEKLFTFAHINQEEITNQYIIYPDSVASTENKITFSLTPFSLFTIKSSYSKNSLKNYADIINSKILLTKNQTSLFPYLNFQFSKYEQNKFHLYKNMFENTNLIVKKNIGNFELSTSGKIFIYKTGFNHYGLKEIQNKNHISYSNNNIAFKLLFNTTSKDSLKNNIYLKESQNKTIGFESMINFTDHFINLKLYHRNISVPKHKNFDMVNINLKNNFLENNITLNTTYKINNLEFYPKIRELVKVNYGLYDSTGALGGEGGYDWIIKYIDYEHPQKSTEVNLSFSFMTNISSLIKKLPFSLQSESFVQLYNNSTCSNKKYLYIFSDTTFYNKNSSILSKKIIKQTFWSEIIKNKLRTRTELGIDNTLDQRYQLSAENKSESFYQELTYRYSLPISFKVSYEINSKRESIYNSLFKSKLYQIGSFFRPSPYFIIDLSVGLTKEKAISLLSNDNYNLKDLFISNNTTLFLGKKYRIFSKIKFEKIYKNSDFLDNIADKTAGLHFKTSININYKLNRYTSANIKYSSNIYDKAQDEHKLTAEVKAEF